MPELQAGGAGGGNAAEAIRGAGRFAYRHFPLEQVHQHACRRPKRPSARRRKAASGTCISCCSTISMRSNSMTCAVTRNADRARHDAIRARDAIACAPRSRFAVTSRAARKSGVRATPGFFIDGKASGRVVRITLAVRCNGSRAASAADRSQHERGTERGTAATTDHRVASRADVSDAERRRHIGCVASARCRPYRAGSVCGEGRRCRARSAGILRGEVLVAPHEEHMRDQPIVTHGPGGFMGELAQLSGRPSLVDATAISDVEAIVIASPRLRDLMVEEADLGERIMRALILRRVGLLSAASVDRSSSATRASRCAAPRGFLTRNGHPHQRLDPDTRRLREDADRTLSGNARGTADRAVLAGAVTAQSHRRSAGALHRHGSRARFDDGVRRRDRRRGTGRTRRVGVRRVGRIVGDHDRLPRVRRTGRRVVAHRELSRLSDRHQRYGADGACAQPGAQVRRRNGDSERGRDARRSGSADRTRFRAGFAARRERSVRMRW